ncbi:MAG: hypothetical protein KJ561_00550 [Nanoarchaeota archaeon]|nr:hypothetical protein [Nanoarchaeota archaeon]
MAILEEDTEINKKPEIDLVDDKGNTAKLEVYEEKEEPIKEEEVIKPKVEEKIKEEKEPKKPISKRILDFYDKEYKKLMVIPFAILLIAMIVIGVQTATTGSFIYKDVSLKGGVTITITKGANTDITALESALRTQFGRNDISVEPVTESGKQIGVIILADIEGTDKNVLDTFLSTVKSNLDYTLNEDDYSVEIMGSSLGSSFFKETFIALIAAFILMSIVVMIYFRTFVPSIAVILCAFSDIIVTLAIVDLMGMKVSTGGIAAFLMLVGYSVDTDMLLTTRLLKRKEGTVFERTMSSVKTGMMMTMTTIGAVFVGIIFVRSAVIKQIMTIIIIGLFVDIIFTWIQNTGILRYYIERKASKIRNE